MNTALGLSSSGSTMSILAVIVTFSSTWDCSSRYLHWRAESGVAANAIAARQSMSAVNRTETSPRVSAETVAVARSDAGILRRNSRLRARESHGLAGSD